MIAFKTSRHDSADIGVKEKDRSEALWLVLEAAQTRMMIEGRPKMSA